MKYNMFKSGIYALAVAALLAGCKGSSNGGFETDKATGVQYRFFNHNESGTKPAMSDFVNVKMVVKTDKDSELNNSSKRGGDSLGTFKLQVTKRFDGCLEQGLTLMSVGDSAEFKVSTDSMVYSHNPHAKMPPFLHAGSYLTFDIKLVKIQTAKEVNDERQQMMMKQMQLMQQRKAQEPVAIAKYIADNNVKAKPTDDSLFFLKREGKGGKAIKDGDSVYVTYKGMLLDGTVFETSDHGPGRNTFPMVFTKNMGLIHGWVEALETMHEGEKVTILLPSAIAYGPQGAPHSQMILPYTPLIFDIEVVRVVSPKK